MKERFKQQLTHQIMLNDYSENINELRNNLDAFWGVLIVCVLMPFVGIPLLLFLLPSRNRRKKLISSLPTPESLSEDDFIVMEDTCIKRYDYSGSDSIEYYLHFSKFGEISVPLGGAVSRTSQPAWSRVKVGDKFYVATVKEVTLFRSFYPLSGWRREPLSEEEIQSEIKAEDEYILLAMSQCRFPKLVARSEMFTDSPTYFKVSSNKTREQRNIVEQMAAQYFSCDLLLALEYILRYCPPHMQERFSEDYTPDQLRLSNIIADHIKDEKKREKAKQNKEKIKAFFKGNDYND